MFACSLVGAVGAIEGHAESLHELRVLREGEAVGRRSTAVMTTATDLAAQLRGVAPLPPADAGGGSRRADAPGSHRGAAEGGRRADEEAAVARVLESAYDGGQARLADLDESTAETAARSPRLAVVGPAVLVPLAHDGPRARNWQPVVAFLLAKLEPVVETLRSVAGRLRTVTGGERTRCSSALAMLETLADVLRRARGNDRMVRWEVDGPWNDQAAFAAWTLDELDGDNHA